MILPACDTFSNSSRQSTTLAGDAGHPQKDREINESTQNTLPESALFWTVRWWRQQPLARYPRIQVVPVSGLAQLSGGFT